MPENLRYNVKRGDSLIGIARRFGLNSLDELLELNPEITNPNLINVGQEIRLPGSVEARSSIPAATVTAAAPTWNDRTSWADLPASVQQKVMAYTQAVKDGKMNLNSVPKQYQQHVYNQGIRNATDEAAPYVARWVMTAPWSIPDFYVRGGLNEGRKLIKRATTGDKSEGDYGVRDYFGGFSWLGKKFEQEHPIADFVTNLVTTPAVMVGGEAVAAQAMDGTLGASFRTAWRNMRSSARVSGNNQVQTWRPGLNAGETAPRSSSPLPAPRETGPAPKNGVKFQAGSKGSGKTGTATRSSSRGYQPNASGKGTYSNEASYAPRGGFERGQMVHTEIPSPFVGTGYWHGLGVPMPEQERTPYVIKEPEVSHVEETIPTNPWIYNTQYEGPRVPYRRGMEEPTYTTAEAPRGRSVSEQPITQESVRTNTGRVVRRAEEKPGQATGTTPTGWFSGYGFTYGPEGGNLIYRP